MEAERTAVQRQRAQETLKPLSLQLRRPSPSRQSHPAATEGSPRHRDLQNAEGLEGSGCKRAAKKRITHSRVGGEKAVLCRCGQG